MAWNPVSFDVDILQCSSQLIRCLVKNYQSKEAFQITFIYGANDEKGRNELWDDLMQMAVKIQGPWMAIRDFNDVLDIEDRVGKRSNRRINGKFVDCVDECELEDLKFSGSFYT